MTLQRPLLHPPEQLLPLLGRHGVTALQQVGHDQSRLDAGRLHPNPTVHPHHQLTGEQLLQVGPDRADGGQQPGTGEEIREVFIISMYYNEQVGVGIGVGGSTF